MTNKIILSESGGLAVVQTHSWIHAPLEEKSYVNMAKCIKKMQSKGLKRTKD